MAELNPFGLTDAQYAEVENLALQCLEHGAPISAIRGYSKDEMEAVYNVAYNLYQQQKYQDAKILFLFLTVHEHMDSRFWLGLGGCCQRLGEYKNAIEAYSYAALIEIDDPVFAFHACECYMALEDWENARKAIDAVTTLAELMADKADHTELVKRTEALSQIVDRNLG